MSPSNATTLYSQDEVRDAALQLTERARHSVCLFTPDMEPALYSHDVFVSTLLRLIKSSPRAKVRILTREVKSAMEQEHLLLRLMRCSDQQFQIKTLSSHSHTKRIAFLIADDNTLLRRASHDDYRSLCYTGDRARVKTQQEEFDQLWNAAVVDPNLRPLSL